MKAKTYDHSRYTLDDFNFGSSQEDIGLAAQGQLLFDRLCSEPKCEYLGQGRHRHAFKRGNLVYKIAWNWDGITANGEEIHISSRHKSNPCCDGITYARCRRLNDVCIIMEYLKPISRSDFLPKWVDYVDCKQVGYNKHNILKAYDYSWI